jgi:hypothetical protein
MFNSCWNINFELDAVYLNFLEYALNRFCKKKSMDLKIEHLNKVKSDYQFLLKFTERVNALFNKIRNKLPCFFEDIFENETDQLKI